MKMQDKDEESTIPERYKDLEIENEVRNVRGLSLRCLGVREERICRERSKGMSEKSRWLLFIKIS